MVVGRNTRLTRYIWLLAVLMALAIQPLSANESDVVDFDSVTWSWNDAETHLFPSEYPDERVIASHESNQSNIWKRSNGTGLIRMFSESNLAGLSFRTADHEWTLEKRRDVGGGVALYVANLTEAEVTHIAAFDPEAAVDPPQGGEPVPDDSTVPEPVDSLAPATVQQIGELLAAKAQRTAAQRKVSSNLLDQVAMEQDEDDGDEEDEGQPGLAPRGVGEGDGDPGDSGGAAESEPVKVDIRADVTVAVLGRIVALGGTVVNSVPKYRTIRAVVPLDAVEKLAALDDVDFIRRADEAFTRKVDTSQGDVAHRTNTARGTHGVTGAGIGIGVISNGVESLARRQATGDVPRGVIVLPGQEGEGDEGTAMLEIVHDLAPGAQLYFATGITGQAQFAANIEALCDAGANVIVDDIGYFLEAVFQDDIITKGVNAAVADGCYYFSAAGNDGNLNDLTSSVWEGDYSAGTALTVGGTTVGTRHDFGGGNEENPAVGLLFGTVVLQWADPLGASSNDYDLFVVDGDGNVVASSTNTQDGTQDPIESIRLGIFARSDARLVVVKASGSDRYLRLQTHHAKLGIATAGNTFGHAAAENTIGVGQVSVSDAGGTGGVFDGTESVRTSSSDGPRRIFFNADGTAITAGNFSSTGGKVLQKPDLSAASCVRTSTPGFSPFCGTSAAAPHAAAIAALAIEAAGGPEEVTLAELRTAMTASTAVLDIEATGTDRDSGAGIVMAPGAIDGLDVAAASRNDAPSIATAISNRALAAGSAAVTINLATTFSDPETDALTYEVTVHDPSRLTATISSATLSLTAGAPGRTVVTVRAADPKGLAATAVFTVTVSAGARDYDRDNDGLIEVSSLAQLDAMRYDLNGDGIVDGATWRPYFTAYPMGAVGMGCPDTCSGYELSAALNFDTNASGTADSGDTYWDSGSGWDPIGSEASPYTATFDGNGHTLSNLFISRSTEDAVGLFGSVDRHSDGFTRSFQGVYLLNVAITGKDYVGSLIGKSNYRRIKNSGASGSVTGEDRVGGLVGESSGTVESSYAAVSVSGDDAVGGLVGHHILNRISESYATGAVSGENGVGGLVGATSSVAQLIVSSYATGPVSGDGARLSSSDSGFIVCGLVGVQSPETSTGGGIGGLVGHSCGRVASSYATGTVSGTTAAGALVGSAAPPSGHQGDVDYPLDFVSGGYWDVEVSGLRVGVGEEDADDDGSLDGSEVRLPGIRGLATADMQAPTGYTGIYLDWERQLLGVGAPWSFGTATQYPVLMDLSGSAPRSWTRFGYQFRELIPLTATTAASQASVVVSWTAPSASQWTPAPTITYTLYRDDGTGASVLASALTGATYTDSTAVVGSRYTYRLAAVINGGEFGRSAPLAVTAGVANQPPLATTPIEDQAVVLPGSGVTVDVASAFRDPDSDALTYTASSSQTSFATVSVSGSQVAVTPVAAGRAVITVTATDAAGSNSGATQRFTATVGKDYDSDGDGLIEVRTLAQLNAMRHDLLGTGSPTNRTAYAAAFPGPVDYMGCSGFQGCSGYELRADLDFDTNGNGSADAGDTYWNSGEGWLPIGDAWFPAFAFLAGAFDATFDGNGHTIANLFIARASESSVGFFREINRAGTIRDLNLTGVDVAGDYRVGALAGTNAGDVVGVHASGAVQGNHSVGGLLGNNWFGANVTRNSSFVAVTAPTATPSAYGSTELTSVGGLVGTNYGLVSGNYATGAVSATGQVRDYLAGGLVGWNAGVIGANFATGRVEGHSAGGLVGRNGWILRASYATGRISGSDDAGGLAGINADEISGSYSTGPVSATATDRGGLVGDTASGAGSSPSVRSSYWDATTTGISGGRTTAALKSPTAYSGIYGSWNLDVDYNRTADNPWSFGTSSQYPALSFDFDGDGTASWQEFGFQLRSGPSASAEPGKEQVVVTWSAVDTSAWASPPNVTYTVYRDGVAVASGLDALDYLDSGRSAGAFSYQVAAVVEGGEAAHSAPVTATVNASATNTAPTAAISASATTVDGGGTVTLTATATDPDSDTLTYAWTSAGGGTFADSTALSTTWTAPAETNNTQHVILILTVTDDGDGTLTDREIVRVTVRPNEPPTASITTSSTTVNGRSELTLAATATDPEMNALTYAWTTSGGGTFADASALSATWTAPVATGAEQTITLTLTVTDVGGATAVDTLQVRVRPNQPPNVSVTPASTTADGGTSVTLDGTATDPDGDTLRYAWTGNGGRFASASSLDTTWTAPAKTNQPQSFTLTLTVTDNGVGTLAATAMVRVRVPANEAPTASITSSGTTVDGRAAVTLAATASDPERDSLRYAWTSNGGGIFANASALNTTWTAPAAASTDQDVELTLTVTDQAGATATDTIAFTVQANQAPDASASPASATVNGGGAVTLDGSATDPEGDRLTFRWTTSGGGRFANAAALDTTWTAPAKTNARQDITLTLTVTDNGAGTLSDTATVAVAVRANEAPRAAVSPTSTTVNGGARVTLDGTASDGDDTALTYAWTSSGGGTFANARALDTTWTAPAATSSAQAITLTLAVADGTGARHTATVSVTVRANQAPIVSVAPGSATVGERARLSLNGTATDPEGTRMTYAWTSNGGGSFANASALDTTWTAPAATSSEQAVTLTLTVTDAGGESATATVAVTVPERNNTAPTVSATTSVSATNGGGAVRLDGTASDPQGDPMTYAWTSNGGGSFANASALDTTWTAPAAASSAQTITLTLTVTDVDSASSTATVSVTVNANQAPSVSARGRPGTVAGGGSVTLDGSATDPEGDGLTYAWSSNGDGTFTDDSALDTTWTAPAKTNAVQNIVLTLTVTDDGAGARSSSARVDATVRANAPPTASASASPATVNGNGTVRLNGTVRDADDTTLTYRWTSSGGGAFGDDTALDTTWTAQRAASDDERVVLTLTATDPAAASASATASVTVRANQGPGVTVSPSRAAVAGEAELTVTGTAADPERDSLRYAWTSNGGGAFADPFAPETTWTAPQETGAPQNITLTLTVTDDGAGALRGIATIAVVVGGSLPSGPVIIGGGVGGGGIGGGGGGGGGGPSGPTPSTVDFEWTVKHDLAALEDDHDTPTGMWGDGTTLWVLENGAGADDAVYAYDLGSGERDEEAELGLAERNRAPRGIWSDRETVWVSDSGQDRIFAYEIGSGERDKEAEFELARRNGDARGIWSDGETLWVLDGVKDSLFGYDLKTGELQGEYSLAERNGDPRGLWSDGVSLWVSDHELKQLWAYELPEPGDTAAGEDDELLVLKRVGKEDFTELSRASNNSPRGLWSDGAVMYVADANDGKVYTYNVPDAIDARLVSLRLEGVDIGEFHPDQTEYEGAPGEGVTTTTVEATAAQRGASVVIEPGDADGNAENGHQIVLRSGTEVTISITSPDGSRERVYRVRLGAEALVGPSSHCFRGDVLEGFSHVVFEGGSLENLIVCAVSRNVVALYVLEGGLYVPFVIDAPYFVNEAFSELYPDGIPPLTPLIVASEGPPSAGPFAGEISDEEQFILRSSGCLRGEIAAGFSAVVFPGGSVQALEACARDLDLAALYVLHEGQWVSFILGAPDFVNEAFHELFPDGLSPVTPLVVASGGDPTPQ